MIERRGRAAARGSVGRRLRREDPPSNRLDGGTGDDTSTGFAETDQFVFSGKHFGDDRITDFSAGDGTNHDVIVIDKSVCSSFSALQSHMHETTAHVELQILHNTILDFGTDRSITLSHVSAASLTRSDFQFV